ncbi:hypothetical protein F511_19847 [Dorcoceras hygrometricum]|uniref:Uncharacterized protein n=1 Tax=Dorcoceras hygrometricum TaxID=472368 RepID=A0A2Z7AQP3_9LAMI|nr:hypothetical protein F511_19847 [Dorcoceras hygrometricum]
MSKRVLVTQGMKRRRLREVLLRVFSKSMRHRFIVATGSPAASESGRYYLLLVFRESLRRDDVSGATSFELVATLRFEVATGYSREREKRCVVLLRLDTQLLV